MDEQYKQAIDLAYLDECLALHDTLEKLSAEEQYGGPRVRDVAGAAGAAGAGAALGTIPRKNVARRIRKLEKAKRKLKNEVDMAAKGVGKYRRNPRGSGWFRTQATRLGSIDKTISNLQKAMPKKWKGPLTGAAALGVPTAAVLGASTPKGREKAKALWEKVGPYV